MGEFFTSLILLAIMFAFVFVCGACYGENKKKKSIKTNDGLKLLRTWEENGKVKGEIQNTTENKYRYVEINLKFIDQENRLVASKMTNATYLAPNEIWLFSTYLPEDGNLTMKIESITGNYQ